MRAPGRSIVVSIDYPGPYQFFVRRAGPLVALCNDTQTKVSMRCSSSVRCAPAMEGENRNAGRMIAVGLGKAIEGAWSQGATLTKYLPGNFCFIGACLGLPTEKCHVDEF